MRITKATVVAQRKFGMPYNPPAQDLQEVLLYWEKRIEPNLDHFAAACPAGVRAVADLVLLDRFNFLLRSVKDPPPHK